MELMPVGHLLAIQMEHSLLKPIENFAIELN